MARLKVARSNQSTASGERGAGNTSVADTKKPVVRFISISTDDVARDPFKYISNPPRFPGEPKVDAEPAENKTLPK